MKTTKPPGKAKAAGKVATAKSSVQLYAGTSGYSYKEWKGTFYPGDVPQDQWLTYYASQLPSVEINNTFYRMPRGHVVEAWRDSVPDTFRFVIKASRRITHQSRLKNATESVGYLLERVELLGDKLGAVLFQLPPNMRQDLDRLRTFQDLLPEHLPVAFEFRHESWLEPAVEDALQSRGHARVLSHDAESTEVDMMTNQLTYLRLRASDYTDAALKKWAGRIAAAGSRDAFVFFKHEDAGAGPKMAGRFLNIAEAAVADRVEPRKARPGKAGPRAAPRKVAAKTSGKVEAAIPAVQPVAKKATPKRTVAKKPVTKKSAAAKRKS